MTNELSKKEALQLIGAQADALVRHLDHHCVAIVGFKNKLPMELGSGTCITIGSRFFIATAAHVIDGFTNDELFVLHTRAPSDVWTPILRRGARGGGPKDPEDVAFLELATDPAAALGKTFVDGSRLQPGVSELPNDNVLVYGYPGESIDRALLEKKKLRVQPVGFLSPTMALQAVQHATPLRADYDLIFEYPRDGNYLASGEQLAKMPAAHGISGGGVWATHVREQGVWAPAKCRLIAIQHEWREYEWARCTQIQHWLDLLQTELPELKADVRNILTS